MPKTLTFLISLMILVAIIVLADWKTAGERREIEENFTVSLQAGNALGQTLAQNEYFAIVVKPKGGQSVHLSGWTISNSRGENFKLPEVAAEFKQGEINELEEITITEEGFLIIATGQSPVGVSFRENLCSGLLGQYQNFTPSLPIAPLGYESYNVCLGALRAQKDFLSNRWRIFLGRQDELWLDSNEVITVFDQNSRELTKLESATKPFSGLTKKILENLKGFMIELK